MANKKKEKEKKPKSINTSPFYIALVIVFVLFIYYQSNIVLSPILGIILFIIIVLLVILEITNGIKEDGLSKNIIEIVAAILIVIVFWFALKSLLHTNYPLDVVPSCSMLPQLKRGDLILLQGINNIKQLNAPIIKISNSDYSNFQDNIQNEFLSCVAYYQSGNMATISQIIKPGYTIGLFETNQYGGEIVQDSEQQNNLIKYTCGSRGILFQNGTIENEAYTTSVTINGTTIYNDTNNSIIVYATVPNDYFYQLGDAYIVHRTYAILNVSGNYFILTKGDNNPGLDLQYGNYPVNMSYTEGKVVYTIPYLGYLKLVLSNSFIEPSGCNSTVINN